MLVEHFDADDLKRWVRYHLPAIAGDIAGNTREAVTFAVITKVQDHGLTDDAFTALAVERPKLANQLRPLHAAARIAARTTTAMARAR